MTTAELEPGLVRPHPVERTGIIDYITTTDHKKIGLLYIFSGLVFFLLSGLLSLLMRAELTEPGLQFMDRSEYNQLFTMHGTGMIFFFAAPVAIGLANYFIPLQIGAPDVALFVASSTSRKVGCTSWCRVLRANSTATCGAQPCNSARIATFMQT